MGGKQPPGLVGRFSTPVEISLTPLTKAVLPPGDTGDCWEIFLVITTQGGTLAIIWWVEARTAS